MVGKVAAATAATLMGGMWWARRWLLRELRRQGAEAVDYITAQLAG